MVQLAALGSARRSSTGLAVLAVSDIQRVGGILHPRRSVFLQVVDLQFGHGGIAGIDVFPLVDQRLRELLAPSLFQLLNLGQCGLDLIGVGQSLALLQFVVERAQPIVHAVHLAGVAAQQVVAQVEAVLHHLEADGVGGIRQFQRRGAAALAACSRCTADQFTRNSTTTMLRMMPKFVYNFLPIVIPISSAARATAART